MIILKNLVDQGSLVDKSRLRSLVGTLAQRHPQHTICWGPPTLVFFSRELKHIQMNTAHSGRAAVLKALRDGRPGDLVQQLSNAIQHISMRDYMLFKV